MAINLQKGQRIDIGLSKIGVGLGWDPNTTGGSDFDLDASAFMIGTNKKIPSDEYLVFYNNPLSPDGALKHSGDDRTGGNSDGDDETLLLNIAKLNPTIQEIVFVVTIYEYEARRQNFGQVRNSFIRIYDEATGEEEPFGEVVVDGRRERVTQLRWPEDEDDEKRPRQDALGRA